MNTKNDLRRLFPKKRGGAHHVSKHLCTDSTVRQVIPLYTNESRTFSRTGWLCCWCGYIDLANTALNPIAQAQDTSIELANPEPYQRWIFVERHLQPKTRKQVPKPEIPPEYVPRDWIEERRGRFTCETVFIRRNKLIRYRNLLQAARYSKNEWSVRQYEAPGTPQARGNKIYAKTTEEAIAATADIPWLAGPVKKPRAK